MKGNLYLDVSFSTIKRYTNKDTIDNLAKISVKGCEWFHNNWKPYQIGTEPRNIGDLWAADGSRFQFCAWGACGRKGCQFRNPENAFNILM